MNITKTIKGLTLLLTVLSIVSCTEKKKVKGLHTALQDHGSHTVCSREQVVLRGRS